MFERAEYDARWAGAESEQCRYSAQNIGYTRNFLRFMDEGLAGLAGPIRALEIGCGDGFFAGQLAQRGCERRELTCPP